MYSRREMFAVLYMRQLTRAVKSIVAVPPGIKSGASHFTRVWPRLASWLFFLEHALESSSSR